jgi:hypothetical protein
LRTLLDAIEERPEITGQMMPADGMSAAAKY